VPFLSFAFIAAAAYLLGSLPTGFLVAKAKGIDIRSGISERPMPFASWAFAPESSFC